jgi:hypothetical protein
VISEQDTIDAIKRIAATRDGQMLRLYLQRHLMSAGPVGDTGALLGFEGGRSFARRLIDFMDQGAEPKSDGSSEPISLPERKPVNTGGARGLARRVPEQPPDAGG